MFKAWWSSFIDSRKAKKFEQAVELVKSNGLTVCEIATRAGTDYIRGADGSWRRIGGKK